LDYPTCIFDISADLIFDNDIPEVIRKIAHGGQNPFLLRVLGSAGKLR